MFNSAAGATSGEVQTSLSCAILAAVVMQGEAPWHKGSVQVTDIGNKQLNANVCDHLRSEERRVGKECRL